MMIVDVDEGFSPVELAADLVMAWLSNPNTRANAEDVPVFLKAMHGTVVDLTGIPATGAAAQSEAETQPTAEFTPAVTVRKSLASQDHILSMIDGKPYRTLTRHLSSNGLTPEDYRARYGLKADYPMTAPSYSEARRAMAKKIGLGRKPGQKVAAKASVAEKPKSVSAAKKAAKAHLSGE
jgi:predicted transcriptional regulator